MPVFSKKELNLAQLWSVVQDLGGSEKVRAGRAEFLRKLRGWGSGIQLGLVAL